jgi:hypothetical protein
VRDPLPGLISRPLFAPRDVVCNALRLEQKPNQSRPCAISRPYRGAIPWVVSSRHHHRGWREDMSRAHDEAFDTGDCSPPWTSGHRRGKVGRLPWIAAPSPSAS